ncbi:hypothetical protein V6N12_069105 [Hibiscus sabdariffa]|uniref:RNase H type-1 domain-containing protein n=1 Tax=Hibiscus sabdariffa TaxID=183260 RepID=A0ABR2FD20_9ROSI
MKDWLLANNIVSPIKFVSNTSRWPILFPYILWNILKRLNDKVFGVESERQESVYVHSVRMVEMGVSRGPSLHFADNNRQQDVDSLEVYRLIKESSGSCGSTLLPHILDLIARPWDIQLWHVRRRGNTLADRVAKLATEEDFLCHRYLDPPSSCLGVLLTEAALAEGGVDG